MHGDQQQVLLRVQLQQRGAKERSVNQMKRTARFIGRQTQSLRLANGSGKPGQVHHRHVQRVRWGDDLNRLPVDGAEGGAQRLVAAQDLARGSARVPPRRAGLRGAARRACCTRDCRARAGRGPTAAAGRTRAGRARSRSSAEWAESDRPPCAASCRVITAANSATVGLWNRALAGSSTWNSRLSRDNTCAALRESPPALEEVVVDAKPRDA